MPGTTKEQILEEAFKIPWTFLSSALLLLRFVGSPKGSGKKNPETNERFAGLDSSHFLFMGWDIIAYFPDDRMLMTEIYIRSLWITYSFTYST